MRRNVIRLGDKTTSDGDVLEGAALYQHAGKPLTFVGAKVYCPACKSTGVIVNVPPFHPMMVGGKQAALEGDLCACKCSPLPQLIASQQSLFQSFDAGQGKAPSFMPPELMARFPVVVPHAQQFQLLARDGSPLPSTKYKIVCSSGRVTTGVTDGSGRTERIKTRDAESIKLYLVT
ncbi:PAAR domain-containing protein [Pseudomonas chlororaphis subsp. aureofaciens]|uniref:PAAR domain-containing protein n=1 Tax=Pseudomonas chlororaphis TaxID=587753 RepID=UPI003556802B